MNDAANAVSTRFVTFVSVGAYVAVTVASTTHEMLLRASNLVTLPLLNAQIPIIGPFGSLGPTSYAASSPSTSCGVRGAAAACGSLVAIHPPEATHAILSCLALAVRAPPIAPACPEYAGAADARADSVDAPPPDDFGV